MVESNRLLKKARKPIPLPLQTVDNTLWDSRPRPNAQRAASDIRVPFRGARSGLACLWRQLLAAFFSSLLDSTTISDFPHRIWSWSDEYRVEQRREIRFDIDQPVVFTVLEGSREVYHAMVKNASGCGLGLETQSAIRIGTPIKIEVEDTILLGEAVYCRQNRQSFLIGIALKHALYGAADLARLADEFSAEVYDAPIVSQR